MVSIDVNGSYGMDDVSGFQIETAGDSGIPGFAVAYFFAGFYKFFIAGFRKNGTTDPSSWL